MWDWLWQRLKRPEARVQASNAMQIEEAAQKIRAFFTQLPCGHGVENGETQEVPGAICRRRKVCRVCGTEKEQFDFHAEVKTVQEPEMCRELRICLRCEKQVGIVAIHQFDEWTPRRQGGQIRACKRAGCLEYQREGRPEIQAPVVADSDLHIINGDVGERSLAAAIGDEIEISFPYSAMSIPKGFWTLESDGSPQVKLSGVGRDISPVIGGVNYNLWRFRAMEKGEAQVRMIQNGGAVFLLRVDVIG